MKTSAGILAYRKTNGFFEFLLVHPAPSPEFKPGDNGWWSIPKGEFTDEIPLIAAMREFKEEIGTDITFDVHIVLTPVQQRNNKLVYGFAVEHDIDVTNFTSNTFSCEYPRGSGIIVEFPEVDKAEWFDYTKAKLKLSTAQKAFIDELITLLNEIQK